MKKPNKISLKSIKVLMIFCQVLLVIFTAEWLVSQYNSQREELRKNLTKLFTDVQHKVSDSLLLTQVIDPLNRHQVPKPQPELALRDTTRGLTLSPQGLHKVLSGMGKLTRTEEDNLFRMDTMAFNEMFVSQMRQNGWDFNAQWINNNDSNKDGKNIFIKSDFFTQENGIVVKDYSWYLYTLLLPQFLFVMVLLSLTTAAFVITFRNLRAQIKLGSLKDDFISNMSHELKTPISTVKLALEALNNYNIIDDPMRSREYLGMATSEMDRLELLATRVLNTSLLENGKMDIQRERYDLKALVEHVLQTMQLRFSNSGAQVAFEATGNNFTVPVDKLHMQGVLVNLLDNSLKYATAHPFIRISLTENNGSVRLAFSDNGPGIPEEYKEKIFEKFFRVPNGLLHNTKGYGLGLSYAAQVMRQHNGSIDVQNITSGGCVFTLTF